MKKILFLIAAVASCMTASAQFWVSGSVGVSNSSTYNNDDTRTNWNFSPAVGYALDDALEVGLELGLSGSSYADDKSTDLSISPFIRYTFLSDGDFSMFLQGNLNLDHQKDKNDIGGGTIVENKSTQYGISIRPGIKYTLTDQFAVVATLGGLYFNHTKEPDPSFGPKNNLGLNINTGLDFGLVYSF